MHDMFREDDVDWDRLAQRQATRLPLAARWWAMLGGARGWRIADVGCGPGVLALRYADWVGPDGMVLAVDLRADALARAESSRDPTRHAALRLARVDVEREPLPERALDAILVTHALHHMREPEAVLRRLRDAGRRILVAEFDPEGPGEMGPSREERLAKADLLRMLRAAGWTPEAPEDMACETYAIVAR